MRRCLVVAVALGGAVVLAACYRPDLGPCSVRCETGCPAGLQCGEDGFCHTSLDEPACEGDGGIPDAGADAMLDGGGPLVTDYLAISAGNQHVCAIRMDGSLACWGQNLERQLGVDAPPDTRTATPVDHPAGATWTDIAAGRSFTCGIRAGALSCWGRNSTYQTGSNAPSPVSAPAPVGTDTDWIDISAGGAHACGIRGDEVAGGTLYCWGDDGSGQLGDGVAGGFRAAPTEVAPTALAETFTDWIEVAAGTLHTCARRVGGNLYCWGEGGHGELGGNDEVDQTVPSFVFAGTGYTSIDAGEQFTCGIKMDALWCWGDNSGGQLGLDTSANPEVHAPLQLGMPFDEVSVGFAGGCAREGGAVTCFGASYAGELGDGTWGFALGLHPVLDIGNATTISSGDAFHCAVGSGGEAWCWGFNQHGQIGAASYSTRFEPSQVGSFEDWQDVALGHEHTCGLRTTGDLYCWGWDDRGQLGHGDGDVPMPMPVTGFGTFSEVGAGQYHTCAVQGTQDVYCWGGDDYGQIGNGGTTGDSNPTMVHSDPSGVDELAVGPVNVCARSDGVRTCWGDRTDGALGDGMTSGAYDLPQSFGSESIIWAQLSLADRFGCARTSSDDLLCWGIDDFGQQGNGPSGPTDIPALVDSTRDWTQVSTAYDGSHACGLEGGRAWCWGYNGNGQMGIGNYDNQEIPAQITTPGSGWTQISAGTNHTCGISNGNLWCWGRNGEAQLGDRDFGAGLDVPGNVLGVPQTWAKVVAGRVHTCAITTGGQLWCWGTGRHGQLGDGGQDYPRPNRVVR